MLVLRLIAAALLQVAVPPGAELQPTEEEAAYQQRLRDYDHHVATLQMIDEDGRDARGVGVFIAPDEMVTSYDPRLFAKRIDIQKQCYGAYEVTHVVGGDLESGVLILRVAPAGEPGRHEVAPATPRQGAIDASHVEAMIGPMDVRNARGAVVATVAPSFYSSDATWVDYAGEPRRLRVPWGEEELDLGAPIFDAEGRLVGVTIESDGSLARLAATVDQLRSAPRFDPVALDEFLGRDLTDAEQAARLVLLSSRDRQDGDFQQATRRLREAIELAPDHWRAWFYLGVALDMSGEPVEALRALLRSHELEPTCAETLYSAGVTLARMGHGGAATHYYNAAIERDPRHAWAYANLVGPALNSGRRDLAAAHMRRAVDSAPREGKYAQMLERLEAELRASQERLAQAEASDPREFPERMELAHLRWEVGQTDAALEAAAEAEEGTLAIDDLFEARGRRLRWLVAVGRYEEAIALAERSTDDLREHPRVDVIEPFVGAQVDLAQGRLDSLLQGDPP
jgi:tetratricopeptide (TPR) repeat protein